MKHPRPSSCFATVTHASADELIEWTRDKLGAVKRVTSVEFVDDLPTSALGKVLRREVKARFLQDATRSVAGA